MPVRFKLQNQQRMQKLFSMYHNYSCFFQMHGYKIKHLPKYDNARVFVTLPRVCPDQLTLLIILRAMKPIADDSFILIVPEPDLRH